MKYACDKNASDESIQKQKMIIFSRSILGIDNISQNRGWGVA